MLKKTLILALGSMWLAGCASVQPSATAQLQTRNANLESQIQMKDQQIRDLQERVGDLSSQVDQLQTQAAQSVDNTGTMEGVHKIKGDIIRVSVSPQQVQTALKNAGDYNGPIDGKVGAGTKAAIKVFQKKHHLKTDGLVGMETWKALRGYLK